MAENNDVLMPADMTLRDYFAAAALRALLSDKEATEAMTPPQIASMAFSIADRMLKQRAPAAPQ